MSEMIDKQASEIDKYISNRLVNVISGVKDNISWVI